MILALEQVVAGYDGSDILKGVNLQIEKGSITCIVGPNGAGKSTVLRTISGILKPRRGSIKFNGVVINGLAPRQIIKQGIVQVPQEHSLFTNISVRENVRLGAYLVRDSALVQRRLDAIEEMFPLVRERANDKAGILSGGQQRMVEFARSLMLDPAIVLLDEPSMGLDPKTRKQVFDLVKSMQQLGKTVLLVEQNVRAGFSISTHGVVMENGVIRLEGSPQELLNNPQVSHLYLGGTLAPAQ